MERTKPEKEVELMKTSAQKIHYLHATSHIVVLKVPFLGHFRRDEDVCTK